MLDTLAVLCNDPERFVQAEQLAALLQLPLLSNQVPEAIVDYAFVVMFSPAEIVLQQTGRKAPGPILVEFTEGAVDHPSALDRRPLEDAAERNPEAQRRRQSRRVDDRQRPFAGKDEAGPRQALQDVGATTKAAWATANPTEALANAVPYLQAFGHTVLAWIWLDVALAAHAAPESAARTGRLGAMRYFFHYELPKIGAWLQVVSTRDATCASFPEDAF